MPKKCFLATSVLCAVAYLLSGQRPPRAPARGIGAHMPQGLLRDAALEQRVRTALSSSPLRFEENVGQANARVKFFARGSNFMLALTPEEAALRIHTPHAREKRPPQLEPEGQGWSEALEAASVVRVEFAGGNPAARLTGLDAQPGTVNYILGNDPKNWHRDVPHFGRVRYEGIYPGVDAVFYGDRRQMEYDFVVAPGADPAAIRMRIEGASSVELTSDGGILARTPAGILALLPPKLYQQGKASGRDVAGRYVWRSRDEIGFEVADYERTRALVIDPLVNITRGLLASPPPPPPPAPTGDAVALSTLLGGDFDDSIQAIVIGATGRVYVTGFTDSFDFPAVGGLAPNSFHGSLFNNSCFSIPQFPCGDVFVAEFDVTTITAPVLVSSTYLGGSGDEAAWGMALNGAGDVYLVGQTDSGDFPITNTPSAVTGFQPTLPFIGGCTTNGIQRPCHHAFFVELDPTLSTLMYSTYLAGSDDDEGFAIAVNGTGQAFLTGVAGPNFPIFSPGPSPLQGTYQGGGDVFVAEIDPTIAGAGGLIYSTYLGGDGTDIGFAIAVNANNDAFVGGVTFSTFTTVSTFPTTVGAAQQTSVDSQNCGPGSTFLCGDGFVSEIDPQGSTLLYSTFLGGGNADQVNAIAVTGTGNVFATGQTLSGGTDFQPVVSKGTLQTTNNGGYDAFVVNFLASAGAGFNYATFYGGSSDDMGQAIAIDGNGDAFVAGATFSSDFPVISPLQTTKLTSGDTSFVLSLNPAGTAVFFATYYGGSIDRSGNASTDVGNAIALDSSGRIYLGGRTTSNDICLINAVPGANQDASSFGNFNAFLTIINPTNTPAACFEPSIANAFLFASTLVGKMSGSQGPLIINQGSAAMNNAISFTGANPTDFPVTNACATIAPGGGSCVLTVAFAPKTTSMESATLMLTNGSAGSPFAIKLQGTGLPLATATLLGPGATSPLAFGNVTTSTTSVLAATLTNTSTTSPLDVASAAVTGSPEIAIQSDGCSGTTVAALGSCQISLAFTPTATGPAAATTLMVTDDGTGSPRSLSITGTGVAPPPVVSIPPLSLTFGPQVQGTTSTAQMVTVTNSAAAGSASLTVNQPLGFTGANAGDFAATGCTTPVAPGSTCTISVTFTPLAGAAGARTGTLQITSNASNNPQTINVTGTDLALPTVTVSPAPPGPVTFPAQILGTTSGPMFVTLTNTSATSPLTVAVALSGGNSTEFGISNGCGSTLAAGANCVVSVTFTPASPAVGARTTTLQFTDNATGAPASPQSVTINGTGVAAPTLTPTLTFAGTQPLNTPAILTATLTNSNTVPLNISSITASGDFSVAASPCGAAVAANSVCNISVTFTPTAAGARVGTLTVIDTLGGAPLTQTSNLSGTGAAPPTAVLAPATSAGSPLVFGVQAVGVTSAAMPVTLMNTGGSTLNISAIAPTGDFGETDNCLPSVAASGMCTINVTFTPSGVGARNGSILILDNAAGGQQTIFVTGTGSSNVPGFNLSAPLFFGAVLVGSTSTPAQTITITNSGGAPLTIASVMLGGTNPGDFAAMNGCAAVVGIGQNCMITLSFSPTANGMRSATLIINDNAPGNPHNVSLSGLGATVSISPPAGGVATATVTPGDSAQYPLMVNGTPGLVLPVNLTCTSSAPFTKCTVSPSSVTLGGATSPLITVTVQTNCNPAVVFRPIGGMQPLLPAPFAALWVGTLALFVLLRRLMPRPWMARVAPAILLILLVVTWAGCINNPAPAIPGAPTTPAGNFQVTVTAVNPVTGKAVTNPPLTLILRVI